VVNVFEWLRNRKKTDPEEAYPDFFAGETLPPAWDEPLREGMRTAGDTSGYSILEHQLETMNSMTQREQEDFFSHYGPPEVREEMRRRRKAREQKP
jgi:hypothetical protein